MIDDIKICAVLRNFQSDSDYLPFEQFWIEKLTEETKKSLTKTIKNFIKYPFDNYILIRRDYIGIGESFDFLQGRNRVFWNPLFLKFKLFKSGDIIMPIGFANSDKRTDEIEIHGKDSYGIGFNKNPYIFNASDTKSFLKFEKEIKEYLKFLNFHTIPYHSKPEILEDIDTRCLLPIHILLKGCIETHTYFFTIDRLIDLTIAFESLYLLTEPKKCEYLSDRVSTLLGSNEKGKKEIACTVKKFYLLRNKIVHGSLIKSIDSEYLENNIHLYEDYLRKSILAFLDLNHIYKSKKEILRLIIKAGKDLTKRNELHNSLKLLKLAL